MNADFKQPHGYIWRVIAGFHTFEVHCLELHARSASRTILSQHTQRLVSEIIKAAEIARQQYLSAYAFHQLHWQKKEPKLSSAVSRSCPNLCFTQ